MIFKCTLIFACLAIIGWPCMAANPTAYIVNSSGETLSKIDLNTGIISNNIITLGSDIYCYPNQIIIRDTLAYAVSSGTAEIQIINLNTESTVGWINFPSGSNPYWMAFGTAQYLYATLMVDNSLAKVDVITGNIVSTTPIGASPEGIIVYKNRAYICITAYDFGTYSFGQGKVAVYDIIGDTAMLDFDIEVGVNPQYLTIDNSGIIHCVCTGDYASKRGIIYRIDPQTNSIIDSAKVGGDPGLISINHENIAFISAGGWGEDGEIYTYNAGSFDIYHDATNPIPVDSGAMGIVAFQDTTAFACTFDDRIFRIDSSGSIINKYLVGDGPIHLDFNYQPGDANGDWNVNIGDAVYLINYIFKGGEAPASPRWRANANADKSINLGDAVYLINYIFKGGSAPKIGSIWIR